MQTYVREAREAAEEEVWRVVPLRLRSPDGQAKPTGLAEIDRQEWGTPARASRCAGESSAH